MAAATSTADKNKEELNKFKRKDMFRNFGMRKVIWRQVEEFRDRLLQTLSLNPRYGLEPI